MTEIGMSHCIYGADNKKYKPAISGVVVDVCSKYVRVKRDQRIDAVPPWFHPSFWKRDFSDQ